VERVQVICFWNAAETDHGSPIREVLAEQKRLRELLAQSRELLKQMQAG
jgi:hypothetical protein